MRFLPLFLAFSISMAAADTLQLKTGVRIDGTVRELPEGLLEVVTDGRKAFYRADEVASIERNDKTGAVNFAEIEAELAAEDAAWFELTGLRPEQRREVLEMMYRLQRSEASERIKIRDALVAMQQRFDVYRFLEIMLPELSHRLTPNVLEVLCHINPDRAVVLVRQHLRDPFAGTRAKAIELLAALRDTHSTRDIARGLADHDHDVIIAGINALATLKAREATPAVIALMAHPNPRASNACRRALETIWADAIGLKIPQTAEEWTTFWQQQEARVSGALQLASLQPLVRPADEFQNE